MLARIRPETIRYALLALNLVLMALALWCGLYAFGFQRPIGVLLGDPSWWKPVEGFKPVTDLAPYRLPERVQSTGGVDVASSRIGQFFMLPSPPPPAQALPEDPEPAQDDIVEEGLVENGPLNEEWEIGGSIVMPDPMLSVITLSKKRVQPPAGGRLPARGVTTISRAAQQSGRYVRPPQAGAKDESKLLRLYDRRLYPYGISIDETVYLLMEIRGGDPFSIVYQAGAGTLKDGFTPSGPRYLMAQQDSGQRDWRDVAPPEEGVGGMPGPAKPAQAATNPDRRGVIQVGSHTYGDRADTDAAAAANAPPAAGTATRTTTAFTPRSAAGAPRTPTAEEVRNLGEAMKGVPAQERQKLIQAMQGGRRP